MNGNILTGMLINFQKCPETFLFPNTSIISGSRLNEVYQRKSRPSHQNPAPCSLIGQFAGTGSNEMSIIGNGGVT